jgi:hypothetical protein
MKEYRKPLGCTLMTTLCFANGGYWFVDWFRALVCGHRLGCDRCGAPPSLVVRWALLVGTTNIFGLALWLIARRRIPVVDVRLTPLKRVLLWLAPVPVLIVSGVLALQVGTLLFLMQVARVEGVAMAPTINNQDRLIVNKLAYLVHPPQRGDIVMHRYPRDPAKTFVKRVIAMGGDTVRSVEGACS